MEQQSEVRLKAPVRDDYVCQQLCTKCSLQVGLFTCNPLKTTETLCSVPVAARLLSQDRWDEFNLIIGADVLFKTFTQA